MSSPSSFISSSGTSIKCQGCIDNLENQMGHYGGCIPDPYLSEIGDDEVFMDLSGKSKTIRRLTSSLSVNTNKISAQLDWQPPFSTQEGLAKTKEWFSLNSED